MVPLVKLDQEENLDYLASLELMVCLARMEHLAKLDLKETKVLRVILVLWDFLALEESKEILVKEELWEKKEKREKLVLKVRRVTWVQKETEAFLDHLESKVRRDHKVLKAQKVPLENLDLLDHLERREKMDHQVLLGIQEDQEIRVTRELREEMVHLE